MLSVNCDQANGFDQSLALIGAEVIKQCLYFGLLLGDFTFGCHYERSGQCVVAGFNIFFRCVYAIELQSFYGIIYNIEPIAPGVEATFAITAPVESSSFA